MNAAPEGFPDIQRAATVLRGGGLVAFPTETVYGLGADARNPEAVARIFSSKGRPTDHPLIVHLADASQLTQWARNIPRPAWQLAEAFWPGPLTLVLPRAPGVLDAVTGKLDDVREHARQLYQRLRQADHLDLQVLVAVMPPDVELGHALRDRLRGAAGLGDGAGPSESAGDIRASTMPPDAERDPPGPGSGGAA